MQRGTRSALSRSVTVQRGARSALTRSVPMQRGARFWNRSSAETLCTKAFWSKQTPKRYVQKHLGQKTAQNITYNSIFVLFEFQNLSQT